MKNTIRKALTLAACAGALALASSADASPYKSYDRMEQPAYPNYYTPVANTSSRVYQDDYYVPVARPNSQRYDQGYPVYQDRYYAKKRRHLHKKAKRKAKKTLRHLDYNRDGYLAFYEIRGTRLARFFGRIDRNRDGYLSFREIVKMHKKRMQRQSRYLSMR